MSVVPYKRGVKRKAGYAPTISKYGPRMAGGYFRSATARAKMFKNRVTSIMGANTEKKFVDSYRSTITLVTSPTGSECDDTTMLCLNGIAQGVTQSTRIGNKVILKSVQVNGQVNVPIISDQADAPVSINVRVMLVLDKQTNKAQLNGEDVYFDSGGVDILSLRNLEYSDRFTILAEEKMSLDYTTSQQDGANTASYAGQKKCFTIYKKLNIPVQYNLTTAVVGAITDNSLHLIAWADGANVNFNWQSRVRYSDK